MLLYSVRDALEVQLTGETKDRYLRLLAHGDKFRDSIQIVKADVHDGFVLICVGGHINPGVSVVISFSDEDPHAVVLDRAVNQLVDEYCAEFNSRFVGKTLKL